MKSPGRHTHTEEKAQVPDADRNDATFDDCVGGTSGVSLGEAEEQSRGLNLGRQP